MYLSRYILGIKGLEDFDSVSYRFAEEDRNQVDMQEDVMGGGCCVMGLLSWVSIGIYREGEEDSEGHLPNQTKEKGLRYWEMRKI